MQVSGMESKKKIAKFVSNLADENYFAQITQGLPGRWVSRIRRKWISDRLLRDPLLPEIRQEGIARANANIGLRELVDRLQSIGLPIDADDSDICAAAEEFSEVIAGLSRVFHDEAQLRKAMAGFVERMGIQPPVDAPETTSHVSDISAIARMTCVQWWRRNLRKLHRKAVEGSAIALGYVNRSSDCYVSNESLARRIQQNNRNAAMLEATVAVNEYGDQYTLAELSAKGVSNKAIRRAELMTRIAGFEVIAKDSGHVGLFITVTCPSRMHKWRTVGKGRVVQNDKYDGTLPNEAQAYLAKKVFSRVRAKWKRCDIHPYGFRIAEPNHDGTPHWHLLLFVEKDKADAMVEIMRDYALEDSGDEAGAQEHRCKVVVIDWRRGSAAGYIAKYVAKNIDGYKVEKDLFGNDALESSARVEAWASTWGIRQFQQLGGAPVGVWRELRRVKELPEDAPKELERAWTAANRLESEGEEVKRADWAEYIRAQGGVSKPIVGIVRKARFGKPTIRRVTRQVNKKKIVVNKVMTVKRLKDEVKQIREWKLKIEKEEVGGLGTYYEKKLDRPIGVAQIAEKEDVCAVLDDEILDGDELERMAEEGQMLPLFFRSFKKAVKVVARSMRYCWEIMRKQSVKYRVAGGKKAVEMKSKIASAVKEFFADHVMSEKAASRQRDALKALGLA